MNFLPRLLSIGLVAAFLGLAAAAVAQPKNSDIFEQNRRLGKGVNCLGYDPIWHAREQARFQEKYFQRIKEAGFDSLRVNLHTFRYMQETNGYRLPAPWFSVLDWVLANSQKQGLRVILDFHEFMAMAENPEKQKAKFLSFWSQVSTHCKGAGEEVLFELLNEPNGKLTPALWNSYLREALAIIRSSNPTRAVIVGPGFWNSIQHLDELDLPAEDHNLIVTVHYYDPMEFTHQGAGWVKPPPPVGKTWEGSETERAAIARSFDQAAAWAKAHNRPLFLGEFGAYDKAPMDSRLRYLAAVRSAAESRAWSWAYWQFDGDFVVYDIPHDTWVTPIRDALLKPLVD
jgi:endoglucanase